MTLFDQKENCCGCTACKAICPVGAIVMQEDEQGFLYPFIIEEKCIKCNRCLQVCPLKIEAPNSKSIPTIYAAMAKSEDILSKSSSGGAFTIISDYFLDGKGVIYGASHDAELTTCHIRAADAESRNRCRGSKYVQSELRDTFENIKNDLKKGLKVFFTGAPCQVKGLLCFLRVANIDISKLYTADLVCHGVPSPRLFKDLITYIEEKQNKKIIEYLHRPKTIWGWPHNEEIIYSNLSSETGTPISNLWRNIFYSNIFLRPACLQCQFCSTCRVGDITLADFWGVGNSIPEWSAKQGVSLLFVNSMKGECLFHTTKDKMEYIKSSLDACVPYQQNLRTPSCPVEDPNTAWSLYHKKGFSALAKKYGGMSINAILRYKIKIVLKQLGLLSFIKKILKKY